MPPSDLLYTKTHEWVRVATDASGAKIATVGITDFAVKALTDLVFIDLPKVGRRVEREAPFGEIESVKAVSDLMSPVAGEVVEVNTALADRLEILNEDPYSAGWMAKIRVDDPSSLDGLLDAAAYERQCAEQGE